MLTKPFTFKGDKLELNFSSSAAGHVRIEIQDTKGNPISGFALEDCPPYFGDSVSRAIEWKNESDLSKLSGQPIQLLFELKDADLYSFRFN
jgi:hypothetical protein